MTHKHPHKEHKTVKIKGIEIDKGIANLITKIWGREVKTYECCQGGKGEEAYLIIQKKDLKKIRELLPKYARVVEGSGGYLLDDYHKKPPPQNKIVYIAWKGGRK